MIPMRAVKHNKNWADGLVLKRHMARAYVTISLRKMALSIANSVPKLPIAFYR